MATATAFIVVAVLAIGVLAATRGESSGPSGAIRVAAAADLQFALDDILADYASSRAGRTVVPTYGSSGNAFSQISNGAPFDLFLSADIDYPRLLEAAGLVDPGTTQPYAIGRIVIWVPTGSTIDVASLGMNALTDPAARRIAIANPQHAPYGRAAVAAMEASGVAEAVADRLVLGENVAQAAQFVESGAADIGIVALSLVRSPTLRDVGRYVEIPAELHPPIVQGAAVLAGSTDPEAARAFLAYVLGPAGRAVLERYGFDVPAD